MVRSCASTGVCSYGAVVGGVWAERCEGEVSVCGVGAELLPCCPPLQQHTVAQDEAIPVLL